MIKVLCHWMVDTSSGIPHLPTPPLFMYLFHFYPGKFVTWKRQLTCGTSWPLQCLGAALHISCLSAANSPWVMMKRFNQAEGKREREIHKERQKERDSNDWGGVGKKKMKGQTQISPASVWQRMWEMNCLIGTFVSIRIRSSVSALTEGFPSDAPH